MENNFKVTLVCPIPRVSFGFGKCEQLVDSELEQLRNYTSQAEGDIVVFPEGFMDYDNIEEAVKLAKEFNKWIVCGSQKMGENKDLAVEVISPVDGHVYSHLKTALTEGDRKINCTEGKTIEALDTPFGKIGTVLCYEIHFPEVARIEAIEGAQLLINTIGTGMWHQQQLDEWTTIAKARAIENRCFVVGCTHYCDPIPLMFAYDPHGRNLALETNKNGSVTVDIDLSLIDERDFMRDRNPVAYTKLSEVKENE